MLSTEDSAPKYDPENDIGVIRRRELQDQAIALLDAVRHAYEAAQINRYRYIMLGRQYGLTNRQIGDVLGLSESGVRRIMRGAKIPGLITHG